jgi:DNA polymerase-3 subunit alpha
VSIDKMFAESDYKGTKEFAHLHVHSLASSLDGVPSAEQYADACIASGFQSMAATEHGHMASFPDMHFAFKKRGLKYIAGCEIYYCDYEPLRIKIEQEGTKFKSLGKELNHRITSNRHLTILCKNATGVSNLIKLTTLAHESYYYKPRVWFEKLCEYKEGLIVLSGCINGPISYEIRLDIDSLMKNKKLHHREPDIDHTATEYIKKFKDAFGEDFFIEVQMPCIYDDHVPAEDSKSKNAGLHDVRIFRRLIELADKYKVKPVIANDCHYLERKDSELQRVMMAVDQKTSIFDKNMFQSQSDEQYLKSRAQLWETFKNNNYSHGIDDAKFEELCDNTLLIAERCEKLTPDTSPKIPQWSAIEPGVNVNERLREIVYERLRERGWDKDTTKWPCDGRQVTYVEQAEIELNRFIDKGFSSYFMITRDIIQWGRKQGWPFGPRGSASGSLVCYLLGIHTIDSIRWGLSFDRFLASSRGGYMLKCKIE